MEGGGKRPSELYYSSCARLHYVSHFLATDSCLTPTKLFLPPSIARCCFARSCGGWPDVHVNREEVPVQGLHADRARELRGRLVDREVVVAALCHCDADRVAVHRVEEERDADELVYLGHRVLHADVPVLVGLGHRSVPRSARVERHVESSNT